MTTETDLYTAPDETVASSLIVCNRGAANTTFRVSVSVNNALTDDKDYIYYDVFMPANDTFIATVGLTLAVGDTVRVYAGSADLSFSLWGTQL